MLLALSLVAFLTLPAASAEDYIGQFANISVYPYAHSLATRLDGIPLFPRQGSQCEFPGGPQCSATTCCRPGERCCPDACCPSSNLCWGSRKCCPNIAETCGGQACCESGATCCSSSPTGCCKAGAVCCGGSTPCCPPGSTCCGNGCCLSGFTCERNECVDSALIAGNKIARFNYDQKKNGCLLVNMCNGLRGKNTAELTYSGKLSDSTKAAKRRQAGCVPGYCRKLGIPGLNSCDEFPPAMSDEGGNSLPTIQRAINCIPGTQNSFQGSILGWMVRKAKLQAGDTFIISIDCDQVLGKGTTPCSRSTSGTPRRDDIHIQNTTNDDNVYSPSFLPGDTSDRSQIILPFDDLGPGIYNVSIQVLSGRIGGAYTLDNLGDNYTSSDAPVLAGQSQQFSFSIGPEGALMGAGMVIPLLDNTTRISWVFQGQDLPAGFTAGSTNPEPTAASGAPASKSVDVGYLSVMVGLAGIGMCLL